MDFKHTYPSQQKNSINDRVFLFLYRSNYKLYEIMFANYFDQPIKKDEQPRLNTGEITKKLTILKACLIESKKIQSGEKTIAQLHSRLLENNNGSKRLSANIFNIS